MIGIVESVEKAVEYLILGVLMVIGITLLGAVTIASIGLFGFGIYYMIQDIVPKLTINHLYGFLLCFGTGCVVLVLSMFSDRGDAE